MGLAETTKAGFLKLTDEINKIRSDTSKRTQFRVRTTDSPAINSSTVLVSGDVLSVPLEANATYEFRAMLFVQATIAGDIRIGWSTPSGTTGRWSVDGASASSTGTAAANSATLNRNAVDIAAATGVGGTSTSATTTAKPSGILKTGSTAGSLTVMYSQNTSDASNTYLESWSHLIVTRLA